MSCGESGDSSIGREQLCERSHTDCLGARVVLCEGSEPDCMGVRDK